MTGRSQRLLARDKAMADLAAAGKTVAEIADVPTQQVVSPTDHGCESPATVRPLAFGPVGFFYVRKAMGPLESPKAKTRCANSGLPNQTSH